MKKRFSLRYKLILIFGLLIAIASLVEGFLAVKTARKAVTEKVEIQLTDKATDTAEIVDGRIRAFFQFLEGLSRIPLLRDSTLTYNEKTKMLAKEAAMNRLIEFFGICDLQGNRYANDGTVTNIRDRDVFQSASQGNNFVAEPRISRTTKKLQMVFAVPIYDDNRNVIGVLTAGVPEPHYQMILLIL